MGKQKQNKTKAKIAKAKHTKIDSGKMYGKTKQDKGEGDKITKTKHKKQIQ